MVQPPMGMDQQHHQQQPQQWAAVMAPPPPPPQQQYYQAPSAAGAPPPPMWNQQPSMVPPPVVPQQMGPPPPQQQYQASAAAAVAAPLQPGSADEIRTLWIGDLQYWMDETFLWGCFGHSGEVTIVAFFLISLYSDVNVPFTLPCLDLCPAWYCSLIEYRSFFKSFMLRIWDLFCLA